MAIACLLPSLFLLPDTKDDLARRVAFLSGVGDFVRSKQVLRLCTPSDIVSVLFAENLYPAFQDVDRKLRLTGLNTVYSTDDISRVISELLSITHFERLIQFEDASWSELRSLPGVDSVEPVETFRALFEKVVALILVGQEWTPRLEAYVIAGTTFASAAIEITLDIVIPDDQNGFRHSDLPRTLTGEIKNLRDIEEVCDCAAGHLSAVSLPCRGDLRLAIKLHCRPMLKAAGKYQSWSELPAFEVGSNFGNTLETWPHFAQPAIRKAAAILARAENLEAEPFRDVKGQPMVRRDSAKAFRVHLTSRHEAMRFHFWEFPDGQIEFSNIGPKSELRVD